MINLADFEEAAAQRLSVSAYDYYRGGARDEIALARNRAAFADYSLAYKVLAGVGDIDLRTQVLGMPIAMPLMAAPTAFHGMAHPEGEVASARGVTAEGTAFILSTLSNQPLERVVHEATGPVMFQLYVYRDRGVTRELVERAHTAGARALVLTVDAPVLACREKDVRNRFTLPDGLRLANLTGVGNDSLAGQGLREYVYRQLDPGLSWKDLEWLVEISPLPVVVKGVVRPDDALRAAERGAQAVVVSNHGGRQLDHAPASLRCVPAIRRALPPNVEVWMDGGVRRGSEVLIACCLGASAVLVGRPILWGLACDGEAGVRQVLQTLRAELEEAMVLVGCSSVAELDRSLIMQ
jgi:4-hydroxymandelate oxidase